MPVSSGTSIEAAVTGEKVSPPHQARSEAISGSSAETSTTSSTMGLTQINSTSIGQSDAQQQQQQRPHLHDQEQTRQTRAEPHAPVSHGPRLQHTAGDTRVKVRLETHLPI